MWEEIINYDYFVIQYLLLKPKKQVEQEPYVKVNYICPFIPSYVGSYLWS